MLEGKKVKRTWIKGSSGSGKRTLARKIGEKLTVPVYHRDQISWGANWNYRNEEEQIKLVKSFSGKVRWIFEGYRFSASFKDGRLENCDTIIYLKINRLTCLCRAVKRYLKHRNEPREDLPRGGREEMDWTLIRYILWDFPRKENQRLKFLKQAEEMGKKVIILEGSRGIKSWCEGEEI